MYEKPDCDTKVHSLKRFLQLMSDGDPQSTESLFLPKDKIINTCKIYDDIIKHKSIFLSKVIYKRLMGFGYSEYSKALCQKKELAKLPLNYENLRCQLVDYCRERKADKDDTDNILEQFDKFREYKIVSSLSNLGEKRKKDHEKYGFCVSSMSHCIRLASQLNELLQTGSITFPRQNADFLRDIRNGKVSKEECSDVYLDLVEKCKQSFTTTDLPDKPDNEAIDELYMRSIKEKLK